MFLEHFSYKMHVNLHSGTFFLYIDFRSLFTFSLTAIALSSFLHICRLLLCYSHSASKFSSLSLDIPVLYIDSLYLFSVFPLKFVLSRVSISCDFDYTFSVTPDYFSQFNRVSYSRSIHKVFINLYTKIIACISIHF